ncbi:hypothetical protein AAZX31_09G065500 [Glycine max]|nr:hypothetical protein GLYMA_09G067650v4 [Glycine max]KAH1041856.1 hypothetical protein GYH30_024269 [Glycine max]
MLTIQPHATSKSARVTLIKPHRSTPNPHTLTLSLNNNDTVGRVQYGFDVFSVDLNNRHPPPHAKADHRLADGVSVNSNSQFINQQNDVVFVSERTGSPRFYISRPETEPKPLPFLPNALFHDRPIVNNGNLYFVSTHEQNDAVFTSWSGVCSTVIDGETSTVKRLTPHEEVDYSPAVSLTGKFLAVASYRSRRWQTNDFRELQTVQIARIEFFKNGSNRCHTIWLDSIL